VPKPPSRYPTERSDPPDELLEEAVALLSRFAGASSASDDPPGLRRMAEILAAELSLRGLAVAIEEQADEDGVSLPVVVATSPATAAGSTTAPLLLVGHFDTVLPASLPRREGGRLFATGAIDMKGGIVVFLKAIDLLARRGGSLPGLRLVLVPDEEVGGAISRRAVATAGRTARAFWVLEPGERRGAAETLVTGRRGMFHWRLEVRGRTAHSGLAFWHGRSAAVAAADWVTRAAALSRPRGGATVNVARLLAGEQEVVTALASAGNRSGSGHHDASRFGTAHQLNVVPDRAVVEGEARFLRLEEADGLAESLAELARDVAARHEVACDFAHEAAIAPVDPSRLPRLAAERAVALAAAAGWELTLEDDRGGISFPNFLPEPGRIPVLDGLGPVGDGMHTRAEHVDLVSLERRIRLLADLLQAEAEAEATGGA
jgi:glutamate carboxypeptidase